MKHVIEDSGSFAEIFDSLGVTLDYTNRCLISNEVLEERNVTLPCNHTFNYVPLYTAILSEKQRSNDFGYNLRRNEMRCPYCREVFERVLPYYERDGVQQVRGVNANPASSTMSCFQCTHSFKDKTHTCPTPAHITSIGTYCSKHAAAFEKKRISQQCERCNAPLKSKKGAKCRNRALLGGGCRLHPVTSE